MSSVATCSVLHKFKSSVGADTGECHASDGYRDSTPSVQSKTHTLTHTHTHARKHTLDSRQQGNTVRSAARGREIKEER